MKIPLYENTVPIQTPKEGLTQLKEAKIPDVLPASYGAQVGAATESVGKQIQGEATKMADTVLYHIQEQEYWKEQDEAYQLYNQYHKNRTNLLYSTDTTDVAQPDGSTKKQITGLMNRPGMDADGIANEYQKWAMQSRNDLLANIKNDRIRYTFSRLANSTDATAYDGVVKHQAAQMKAGERKSMDSTLSNIVNQTETAQDPHTLSLSLDAVDKTATQIADRFHPGDEETATKLRENNTQKAINNAIIGNLNANGNVTEAKALLDSQKDKLAPHIYDNALEKLETHAAKIQSLQRRMETQNQIQSRIDVILDIANGKFNMERDDEMIKAISIKDPDLGAAIHTVNAEGGNYMAEVTNEGFEAAANDIYGAKSQEELSTGLVNVLTMYGNKEISADKLSILINGAAQRAKSLKLLPTDADVDVDPKQAKIDAGFAAVKKDAHNVMEATARFLKEVVMGKDPQVAAQAAAAHDTLKQAPDLMNYPEGRVGVDRRTGLKWKFYPDGRKEPYNGK